jgi:PhzF family phenazine biosynthesis protein
MAMPVLRFKQVDVFTARPFFGNPVAVVLDAAGLDTETMQRIAMWTNLSETTFVVPTTVVDADYHVRIFTPQGELPFAGHPTVGTAHAVLEAGLVRARDGRLRQQCAAGVLQLTVVGEGLERRISVEAPTATFTPLAAAHLQQLEGALGTCIASTVAPAVVNVGAQWLVAELADASAVRALTPDMAAVTALSRALGGTTGVTVFGRCREADYMIVTRSFAPAEGIPEDPVCGSGNASVGAFMHRAGVLPAGEYVASQGREIGRDGYVTVRVDDVTGRTWIGGPALTCVDGMITV